VTETDGELLRAHQLGDRYAFNELVNRHTRTLWTVARRTLDDDRDAAEAVQDALLRAHRGAAGYRGDASVRGWLVRILVNVCRDRYRYDSRRVTERRVDGDELARIPARRDPIAEHQLRMDLCDALTSLPIEQRMVIVLVTVLGHPVEEVADMLEVSVGTVKSRGHRARARLAELLAERPTGSRVAQLVVEGTDRP
jgi:RNA polymerase sigma-70 factor (ECF subfamily)